MNKKRLIGYLLVIVSVGCIHAQEKKLSVPEYKLWYDCPAPVSYTHLDVYKRQVVQYSMRK